MPADTIHVAELADAMAETKREARSAVVKLALLPDGSELFVDPSGTAWVTIPVGEHLETFRLGGKGFRDWLIHRFYLSEGVPPKSQDIQDALDLLRARALYEGSTLQVHLRCAEHQNHIYVDLGDPKWRAIEIGADGWRVVERPPVKFQRPPGLLPLPEPKHGGDLADLRRFIHAEGDEVFILVVAWLVGAIRPHGPYPVLAVEGEQGAGKSTACRMLRALVDPNGVPLRRPPKDERDLFISAANSWAVTYDNLSGAPDRLSDALCVLATGGGFATRRLYEDMEEVLIDVQRPVMLNGIDSIARRQDLRDRTIRILLTRLEDSQTLDETTLWEQFELAHPALLGALCDALSTALRNWDTTQLDKLPRLADFARWVVAAEPALPWEPGQFMRTYLGQLDAMAIESLEGDAIASALMELLRGTSATWSGTASELHAILSKRVHGAERTRLERTGNWPANPQALSNWLRRMGPDLRRAVRVDVQFRRQGHNRTRTIILSCEQSERHASAPTSM